VNFADPRLPLSFWDRVVPEPMSGCWLWLGRIDNKGYGRTQIRGFHLAHRLALSVVEPLDAALTIDHKCETKCCVNPLHMHQVTARRNNELRGERSTVCVNGHAKAPGDCRECARARSRRHKALKREVLAELECRL
jgi:hypothetical protein